MYKIALHRFVWFPYRPEHRLIGPLLAVLLVAAASTGVVKAIDILTPYNPLQKGASQNAVIILLFLLCFVLSIAAARSDYLSLSSAAFPCAISVLVLVGFILVFTKIKSDWGSAALQAGVSAFATVSLIGRYVQSGGVDLGGLGSLQRRTTDRARALLIGPMDPDTFKKRRAELSTDVESLAKNLREAAKEVTHGIHWVDIADKLDGFVVRSKLVADDDYVQDIREILIDNLEKLTQE